MYIKYYVIGVIIMLIMGYFIQRGRIERPMYRGYKTRREPPPRFWGPFSRGEFIGWIVRSVMLPLVLLFDLDGIIPERAMKVVLGVHVALWIALVPFFIEDIVDGKW